MKFEVGDEVMCSAFDATVFIVTDIQIEDDGPHYVVAEHCEDRIYQGIHWSVVDMDERAELTVRSKIRKMFEL
jgi:hypothetical protein